MHIVSVANRQSDTSFEFNKSNIFIDAPLYEKIGTLVFDEHPEALAPESSILTYDRGWRKSPGKILRPATRRAVPKILAILHLAKVLLVKLLLVKVLLVKLHLVKVCMAHNGYEDEFPLVVLHQLEACGGNLW